MAASLLFVVLTVAAMLAYPGGALYDRGNHGYLFFQNFFSDLGATKTYAGHGNTTSHVLFIVALVGLGLATIGFSTTWRVIAARRDPVGQVLDAHNAFVKLAFGVLLVFILCLLSLQLRNGWPTVFVAVNLTYLIQLAIYVLVLFVGPGLGTKSGLEFQVAAQKIIVYSSILNMGAQAAGIRCEARLTAPAPKPGSRRA